MAYRLCGPGRESGEALLKRFKEIRRTLEQGKLVLHELPGALGSSNFATDINNFLAALLCRSVQLGAIEG